MARRDWPELSAEFAELQKSEGMNLTQFCKLKGINRSTAANQINTNGTRKTGKAKNKPISEHLKKKRKAKAKGEKIEKHIIDEKIEFFTMKNNLKQVHADFILSYFEFKTIKETAEHLGITPQTAYNYLNNPEVQKTIDDIVDTNYEVSTTTPKRIRGRMCIIANANMKDFFDDDSGQFKEPNLWTRSQGLAVKEIKIKPNEYGTEFTIKLYDAMDAMKTLGKVHNLFEKPDGEPDEFKDLSDEELEELIAKQDGIIEKVSVHNSDGADG